MFRAALQKADLFWLIWFYVFFVPESGCRSADVSSCHEVKTAYLLRQIGPVKLVPDRPGAGQKCLMLLEVLVVCGAFKDFTLIHSLILT